MVAGPETPTLELGHFLHQLTPPPSLQCTHKWGTLVTMNSIGVVAIAFIAGIFLIVIVLAVVASLWVAWDARRQGKALLEKVQAYEQLHEQDKEAMVRILDSGKNVFQGIRAEMVKSMEAQSGEMRSSFQAFEEAFRVALKNLNGKSLLEAAKQNVVAMRHLDEVATALHQLVISANETQNTPREWMEPSRADEHAPEGQSKVRSIYNFRDQIDEAATEEAFDRVAGDLLG